MPQIEEVQFVWWGPFRPDTVPLAVDGINVATPNGAGKTAFLDGMKKLLLGTEQLKAKPVDYIYVSDQTTRANPPTAPSAHCCARCSPIRSAAVARVACSPMPGAVASALGT